MLQQESIQFFVWLCGCGKMKQTLLWRFVQGGGCKVWAFGTRKNSTMATLLHISDVVFIFFIIFVCLVCTCHCYNYCSAWDGRGICQMTCSSLSSVLLCWFLFISKFINETLIFIILISTFCNLNISEFEYLQYNGFYSLYLIWLFCYIVKNLSVSQCAWCFWLELQSLLVWFRLIMGCHQPLFHRQFSRKYYIQH